MKTRIINRKVLPVLLCLTLALAVFPLTAFAAPAITTTTLPDATVDETYSEDIETNGEFTNPGNITWTIDSGTLPPGLNLSTATGATATISGTSTDDSSSPYSFTVKAAEGTESATQSLSITVEAAPAQGDNLPELAGTEWHFQIDSTGDIGGMVTPGTGIYAGAKVISVTYKGSPVSFIYNSDFYEDGSDQFGVTNAAVKQIIADEGFGDSDSFELTATFDKNAGTVVVTIELVSDSILINFDVNGGIGTADGSPIMSGMRINAGGTISVLPTPRHAGGLTFVGWFTERSGGTRITTSTVFDVATTVYAHWTSAPPVDNNDDDDDDDWTPSDNDDDDDDDRYDGGSSGGSGSSSGGGSSPTPSTVTSSTAQDSVTSALEAAQQNGSDNATARLTNPGEISLDVLQSIASQAGDASLKVNADRVS